MKFATLLQVRTQIISSQILKVLISSFLILAAHGCGTPTLSVAEVKSQSTPYLRLTKFAFVSDERISRPIDRVIKAHACVHVGQKGESYEVVSCSQEADAFLKCQLKMPLAGVRDNGTACSVTNVFVLAANAQVENRTPGTQPPPSTPPSGDGKPPAGAKGPFDVRQALASTSTLANRAVFYAEGTWAYNNSGPTDAYWGHSDSNRHNIGGYSCTVCGDRSAASADSYFLTQHIIDPWAGRTFQHSAHTYLSSVQRFSLPETHPMLIGAFMLLSTQSSEATFADEGLLDTQFGRLRSSGVTCSGLLLALFESYRDPRTGRIASPLGEAGLKRDQVRRLSSYEWFLRHNGKFDAWMGAGSGASCESLCRSYLGGGCVFAALGQP